jgi:hypothetical protein
MNLFDFLPPSVVGIAALVGTYCLILAYERQHAIENTLLKGQVAIGTVIEIRTNPDPAGGEAPVVDFNTPNGSHRHYSTTYLSPCAYKVGQKVQIWYKFYKSNRAVALPDDQPGKQPRVFFVCGVVLCLLTYPEIIRRLFTMF